MRAIAFIAVVLLAFAGPVRGQDEGTVYLLKVEGAIGPATSRYISEGLEAAADAGANAVVIRLNTPGGLMSAMRDIIQDILASPVPVITYVAPEGARAASAGTYILYASHVAAMAPATNLGAATPVKMGGGSAAPEDGQKKADDGKTASGSAMHQKIVNDAVAYIRSLAQLRNRNADWAEKAVRQAATLTASAALEKNVIDLKAESLQMLLSKVDGMEVTVQGEPYTLHTAEADIKTVEPGWRTELLSVITHPTVAYILMLVGIYGLLLEGYNPGAILPGVVGAISLLLALYAFQILPVNFAGLALIALGVILMIAELLAPSFGALGFGGLIAFVFGSVILMDTDIPGYGISPWVIGGVATVSGLVFLGTGWLAMRSWGRPVVIGQKSMVGARATVLEDFRGKGRVFMHGEIWRAKSDEALRKDTEVRVYEVDGLTLTVGTDNDKRT